MQRTWKNFFLLVSAMGFTMILSSKCTAFGQTLTTAETIGKDKIAFFVATNGLIANDFTTLHYGYTQILYGVGSRVDLYAGAGIITAFGRSQINATVGANVNLWNRGVAVSNFNLFTTGLTKREDSSNLLWFNSTIVSKNLKIAEKPFTFYSGYSFLAPFGPDKTTKLFTPPRITKTVPLGMMLPIKKTAIFVEYNYGKKLQAASLGVSYTP